MVDASNPIFRHATIDDLKELCWFTDFWLAGRGKRVNAPGALNDCFISPAQHTRYLSRYQTFLALDDDAIIAWAVLQYDKTMIHFLIAGTHRAAGIGTVFLQWINPPAIRSKSDQSTGDPTPFYTDRGYALTQTLQSKSRFNIDRIKPNRLKNIKLLTRSPQKG